jgi:hypothetical protein
MPTVERKEMWVNVYSGYTIAWPSPRLAERKVGRDRIGVIRIVIEGDDFTVEKVMK